MEAIWSQITPPNTEGDLNAWLFIAAVFVLAAAIGVLAKYVAALVKRLADGQLVPRDVAATEQRLADVLAQVSRALEASAEREREFMMWIRTRTDDHTKEISHDR